MRYVATIRTPDFTGAAREAYTGGMDVELKQAIDQLNIKIDAVHTSVEKTRKYLLWTFIISVIVVVLPLIGLMLVIPSFLDLYSGLSGL